MATGKSLGQQPGDLLVPLPKVGKSAAAASLALHTAGVALAPTAQAIAGG
jgi:hypothetical protein